MTAALEGGEWSAARPGRTLPPEKTRYPFYSRLGGPQGWSGRAENLVTAGIQSRTVHPVAQSLYRLSYRVHLSVQYEVKIARNSNQSLSYFSKNDFTHIQYCRCIDLLTPNDPYRGRTAPLTSKVAFCIFIQQI